MAIDRSIHQRRIAVFVLCINGRTSLQMLLNVGKVSLFCGFLYGFNKPTAVGYILMRHTTSRRISTNAILEFCFIGFSLLSW